MRHCIISEGPTFRLERWGGGLFYALTHKGEGLSVFFQGDDAAEFESRFELAEANYPDWLPDQICGHLWHDHEYGTVAQPVEAV